MQARVAVCNRCMNIHGTSLQPIVSIPNALECNCKCAYILYLDLHILCRCAHYLSTIHVHVSGHIRSQRDCDVSTSLLVSTVVPGNHVYQAIWELSIGELVITLS